MQFEAFGAFVFLASVIALIVLFYTAWQSYCIDDARQKLFEQRDRLFDLCAEGHWSFDSDEYRKVRSDLEVLIRFTHRITMPTLLMAALLGPKKPDRTNPPPFSIDYNALPNERVKAEVRRAVAGAAQVVIRTVVRRSAAVMVLTGALLIWGVLARLLKPLLPVSVSKMYELAQASEGKRWKSAQGA